MWATTKKSGFTIVEMLIVIVIISVLATLSFVAYNGVQQRAELSSLLNESSSNAKKLDLHNTFTGSYPASISDCPTPAAANLCLTPSSGTSYVYTANAKGGTSRTNHLVPSYELTVYGGKQFLYTSLAEVTSSNEFMQYMDMAPIIDTYGLKKYQLSFDIKSANTSSKSTMQVYFQNGSTAKYGGLYQAVDVTTEYTKKELTFTANLNNGSVAASMLAFYGTYSTGNIPTVKNLKIQLAP